MLDEQRLQVANGRSSAQRVVVSSLGQGNACCGRIPADATPKQRMARKLRTKPGRAAYARRKAIVEPVFGQIITCHNGRTLLLRGLDGARAEWRLLAACHNLRKIFRHTRTTGRTAAAT